MHDQTVSSLGIGSQLFLDGGQQSVVQRKRWNRRLPMPLPVPNRVCDCVGKLTTRPPQYRDGNTDGQTRW
jgi:hypothetical protein